MKNIEEIIMANGIAVMMMVFLLISRRKYRESTHKSVMLYDAMVIITIFGAILEIISFLIDEKIMMMGRFLNYATNTLCFAGTVSIGFLWCMYVDLRVYRNYIKARRDVKILIIPWLIEILALLYNLTGSGFMFTVSADNVYQRNQFVIIGYITLLFYFAYSVHIVNQYKKSGLNLRFFPVYYFIGPCVAGVLIQFFRYGITSSWIMVAVALIFVQMEMYSENLMIDSLTGLCNRRYMNAVLRKIENDRSKSLYGIMLDVNDFKSINDTYGHAKGDKALCRIGKMLLSSLPCGGVAIRYAGDEFMILLVDVKEEELFKTMRRINRNLQKFNETTEEAFSLSISMGYAKLADDDKSIEPFLYRMDQSMYDAKREFHSKAENDRRKPRQPKNDENDRADA